MKHAAKINLGGLVIDVITIGDDVSADFPIIKDPASLLPPE